MTVISKHCVASPSFTPSLGLAPDLRQRGAGCSVRTAVARVALPSGWTVALLVVVALAVALAGCGREADPQARAAGAPGGESTAEVGPDEAGDEPLRVVTLAPGLTQMVVDLGRADEIVGIAEHDAAAPEGLPVVGNFADVHTEALLALRPTHVLTMATKQRPPARLRDLAAAGHFELVTYPYPATIEQVADILADDGDDGEAGPAGPAGSAEGPPVGQVLGDREAARQLRQRMLDRLAALRRLTEAGKETGKEASGEADREPGVLMVIGTGPLMASGPGTVLDQMLEVAGGRNVAGGAAVSAPTYDRESLIALEPEVILLLLPGAPPLREHDSRLAELRDLPIPAVDNNRIHLLNDPTTLLPSTNMPRIVSQMVRVLHPELAEQVDALASEPGRESASP